MKDLLVSVLACAAAAVAGYALGRSDRNLEHRIQRFEDTAWLLRTEREMREFEDAE